MVLDLLFSELLLFQTSRLLRSIVKTMGKIGTHNGKFHCDEALACFMLKQLGEFKEFDIVRYRSIS